MSTDLHVGNGDACGETGRIQGDMIEERPRRSMRITMPTDIFVGPVDCQKTRSRALVLWRLF